MGKGISTWERTCSFISEVCACVCVFVFTVFQRGMITHVALRRASILCADKNVPVSLWQCLAFPLPLPAWFCVRDRGEKQSDVERKKDGEMVKEVRGDVNLLMRRYLVRTHQHKLC